MYPNKVRMNITLPEPLARELEEIAGQRNRSEFIAEALELKIKDIRRQRLNKLLVEGYRENRQEAAAISKEFEAADLEGWGEE
jgi:CopG family transcriptional regulator / antitoxin EndoAI